MDTRFSKVDALCTAWDKTNTPGLSLSIIQKGEVIYSRGYGMADLEHCIPIQPHTSFYLASVSKQFAAMCIALLAEEGLISLDDDVRKYIPEIPLYESTVTIRHLVHHTSGVRDYLELFGLAGWEEDELITTDEALEMMARQRGLNFTPGDEYLYSNSGYVLLSIIVHRASGKSMRQYADEKIFSPLGMKNSHVHDHRNEVVPERATGFSPIEGGYAINIPHFETYGDGGIYSTVEDLYHWDQNFYHNILGKGSPDLLTLVQTPGTLNSGEAQDYAFGLGIRSYRGLKTVGHGGAYGGYRTNVLRFPEQSFSVIILSNLSTTHPDRLCEQIADIFLADQLAPVVQKNRQNINLFPFQYEDKVGMFWSPKGYTTAEFFVKEDKFWTKIFGYTFPLAAQDESNFYLTDPVEMEFHFDAHTGQGWQVKLQIGSMEPIFLEKLDVYHPPQIERKELVGEYYCDELQAKLKLFEQDDKLMAKIRHGVQALEPAVRDTFLVDGKRIFVDRDDEEEVTSLIVQGGRIRNVRFVRIPKM